MDNLPRRQIVVATVFGTVVLTALFLAQGTTQLVGASLLPVDARTPEPPRVALGAGGSAATKDRDPMPILRRNIFDSTSDPLAGPATADTTADEPGEEEEFDPNAPARPCSGDSKLVASIVNDRRPDWSFAAISASSETLLYRTGMQVGGKELVAIRSQEVYLREGAGTCLLAMFAEEVAPGSSPAAPEPAERPEAPTAPGGTDTAELDSNITRVSDNEYNITRSLVDQLLQDRSQFIRQARIIPHEENGRVVGIKLYGIRRTSLLGKLGLQNGDMLRTINGYDMTSPDSALEAYARLRTANHLTLNLVRRGTATTMDFNIQ